MCAINVFVQYDICILLYYVKAVNFRSGCGGGPDDPIDRRFFIGDALRFFSFIVRPKLSFQEVTRARKKEKTLPAVLRTARSTTLTWTHYFVYYYLYLLIIIIPNEVKEIILNTFCIYPCFKWAAHQTSFWLYSLHYHCYQFHQYEFYSPALAYLVQFLCIIYSFISPLILGALRARTTCSTLLFVFS